MVIALFALSLVMIVGGIAAVVQGFPYVRLESGLAMVIGGSTAASTGAVVLGIAVALLELKKLAGALAQRGSVDPEIPTAQAPALRAPAVETAALPSSMPAAATAGAAGLAGISLGAVRDLLGGRDKSQKSEPSVAESHEAEPPLPGLIPPAVPSPVPPPAPGEPISSEDDLFVSPEDRPGHRAGADSDKAKLPPDPAQEEFVLRPALEEPTAEKPDEPEIPAEEPKAEPPKEKSDNEPKSEELQVVGTYTSGANTYVMFANGTIQADTPRGRFNFQSLDELKEFVDSGGETTTRGAA